MDKKHLTPADMKQREKYIKGMKKSNEDDQSDKENFD
jgi:hypothetical protein